MSDNITKKQALELRRILSKTLGKPRIVKHPVGNIVNNYHECTYSFKAWNVEIASSGKIFVLPNENTLICKILHAYHANADKCVGCWLTTGLTTESNMDCYGPEQVAHNILKCIKHIEGIIND